MTLLSLLPALKSILAFIGVAISAGVLLIFGELKEKNKQLNREARGVKAARKIEDENRNLTRDELIDKL